jgi:hypothetical protein
MSDTEQKPKDFAKGISNETLCQYFYVMFIIISSMVALVILADIYLLWRRPAALGSVLLRTLPTSALAIVNSLFLYLLCSRSLLK